MTSLSSVPSQSGHALVPIGLIVAFVFSPVSTRPQSTHRASTFVMSFDWPSGCINVLTPPRRVNCYQNAVIPSPNTRSTVATPIDRWITVAASPIRSSCRRR